MIENKVEPKGVEPSTSRVRYASEALQPLIFKAFGVQIAAGCGTGRNPAATWLLAGAVTWHCLDRRGHSFGHSGDRTS